MSKPNFFIIGAPKCGTTAMANFLENNPQVFMSFPKEPNFFNTDHNIGIFGQLNQYLKLFKNLLG
jgi:hypothetical protein